MGTRGSFVGLALVFMGCTETIDGPQCGEGTVEVDDECVPAPSVCGSGTHLEGGMCVPDPPAAGHYELRVVMDEVRADGRSKFPVLAIGTNPDGTPSTDQVIFNVDRAEAGTFTAPTMTLGPHGATTYFVACDATMPGCTGPVRLTLALASAPGEPITSVDVELVPQQGVSSAAPCLVGGNVLFLDGDGSLFDGLLTNTAGTFVASGADDHLSIYVTPDVGDESWSLRFDSSQLGVPLAQGVYEMAERWPFQSPGRPGISIFGDSGCNTLTGRFEVHEHIRDASGVVAGLVSFDQHCGGVPSDLLYGCVRFVR